METVDAEPPDKIMDTLVASLNCDCHLCTDTDEKSKTVCIRCRVCYFKHLELSYPDASLKELRRSYAFAQDDCTYSNTGGGAPLCRQGMVAWICTDCTEFLLTNGTKTASVDVSCQMSASMNDERRDAMLTELNKESSETKKKLDEVLNLVQNLAPKQAWTDSPNRRKYAKVASFDCSHGDPVVSSKPLESMCAPALRRSVNPNKNSELVKINVKANDDGSKLLSNLHGAKGALPKFTGRKKNDGSVDMLFQDFNDAKAAKDAMDKNLANVTVTNPVPNSLKRYNLVGLQFEMKTDEVVNALIDENRHLFELQKASGSENVIQIKDDPTSCIHIHRVDDCNSKVMKRVLMSVSGNMLASLGNRRLSLGYVKCKLYNWTSHKRCYDCNEIGHYASKCENPIACSKCSQGHRLKDCKSKVSKCVNCSKNNRDNVDHPSYSHLCPYNSVDNDF